MKAAANNGWLGAAPAKLWSWPGSLLGETARQGMLSLVDQAIVSGTRFMTTVIIGRMCGADELGSYALGFSIVVLVGVLQESLITTPYAVLGSRERGVERKLYAGSLFIHHGLLSWLAAAMLGVLGVLLWLSASSSPLAPIVWALAATLPFALLREFARRFAFANLNVSKALALDVLVAIVQLGGLVLLAVAGVLSAATAFFVMGVACALAGTASLIANRRRFRMRRQQFLPDLARNWSFGKWLCGSQTMGVVSSYSIHWMLTLLVGTAATGVYAACATVVMLANPFLLGMGNVVEPKTARAWAEGGKQHLQKMVRQVTLVACAFTGAFWLVIFLAGERIIALLFDDPAFANQGATITTLCTAVLVVAAGIGYGNGLKAMGRPEWNFYASLADVTVMLLTAVPLAWKFGMFGAAMCLLCGCIAGLTTRYFAYLHLIDKADEVPS